MCSLVLIFSNILIIRERGLIQSEMDQFLLAMVRFADAAGEFLRQLFTILNNFRAVSDRAVQFDKAELALIDLCGEHSLIFCSDFWIFGINFSVIQVSCINEYLFLDWIV